MAKSQDPYNGSGDSYSRYPETSAWANPSNGQSGSAETRAYPWASASQSTPSNEQVFPTQSYQSQGYSNQGYSNQGFAQPQQGNPQQGYSQQNSGQQAYYESGSYEPAYEDGAQKSRTPGWLWALITLLVLGILATAAALFGVSQGWFGGSGSGSGSSSGAGSGSEGHGAGSDEIVTVTSTADEAAGDDADNNEGAGATVEKKDPEPEKEPKRSFSNAWAEPGTPTSGPFVDSVRDAYISNYNATGDVNATIGAYSPVTGTTYTMNCSDQGSFVRCSGGNHAVVNIS